MLYKQRMRLAASTPPVDLAAQRKQIDAPPPAPPAFASPEPPTVPEGRTRGVERLPTAETVTLQFRGEDRAWEHPIWKETTPDAVVCNPSVFWWGSALRVVARVIEHPFRVSRAIWGRISADDEGLVTDLRWLEDSTAVPSKDAWTHGLEDLRVWTAGPAGEEVHGCATACDRVPGDPCPKMVRLRLDLERSRITSAEVRATPGPEKNWMPACRGRVEDPRETRWVYATDPSIVLPSWDAPIPSLVGAGVYDRVRGGSPLIPWDFDEEEEVTAYVAIVHEVRFDPRLIYLHRFVVYDPKTLAPIQATPLFYFDRLGVEFAIGLVRHDAQWVVSYGVETEIARMAWVKDETIRARLRPWEEVRLR